MPTYEPLAEKLRPSDLVDFVGQNHLLESDKPIGKALADKQLPFNDFVGPFRGWENNSSKNYM